MIEKVEATQRNKGSNASGLTVLELLVSLSLISFVFVIGVNGFQSFFTRMQVKSGVRAVTTALNSARADAIGKNKRVKVELIDRKLQLMKKQGTSWKTYRCFELDSKVSFSMNASPVFSPYGSVAPLCSIYVENKYYRYKITISMAGKIKVVQLK